MLEFKPGDVFVTTITGNVGRLVQIGEFFLDFNSDYHHAGVIIDESGTTVEAQPGGARLGNIHLYEDRPILISSQFNIDFTVEQRVAIVEVAKGYIGTPYSFLDYVAIAFKRLHLPSKRIRAYVKSTNHMICSQLADKAWWEGAEFDMFRGTRDPQDVTPGNIANCWAHHWN